MKPKFIQAVGIDYRNEIKSIKKHNNFMQPIFEAFTNAWEAIGVSSSASGKITIDLYILKNLTSEQTEEYDFDKIVISDNGVGLDNDEFGRFQTLRDTSKSTLNKGTGRVQYLHSFDEITVESVYKQRKIYKELKLTLSKRDCFLSNNSFIRQDSLLNSDKTITGTQITFLNPIVAKEKGFFANISIDALKQDIIRHYLVKFCDSIKTLPSITIRRYINTEEDRVLTISSQDIPTPDKEQSLSIPYSKRDGKKVIQTDDKEKLYFRSFKIPASDLDSNGVFLTSKGESAIQIGLSDLLKKDVIEGFRYLFLISGKYLDENDSDQRGSLGILTAQEFKKIEPEQSMFPEEVILIDNIEEEANRTINTLHPEIAAKSIASKQNLDRLRDLFLLDNDAVETLRSKLKITDTDEDILSKIYDIEDSNRAKNDAKIKANLQSVESLLPTDANYQEELKEKVAELTTLIPLQNRTALTRYVARRKIVLHLFDQILQKELLCVKKGQKINEDLLHNLIFKQHTTDSNTSDMWLVNEDFIYFEGVSEQTLRNTKIKDKPLFKTDLTSEEEAYMIKCGTNAGDRRPDILLFPDEGKCIIIEFKAPHVDAAEHLHQINRYARLINNLSAEEYNFTTFYGYLIGENIDIEEIRDSDPNYKSAYHLDYIFRPYLPVVGKFNRKDGALYTEVIKYSTLLKRAQLRNKVFIDKLDNTK